MKFGVSLWCDTGTSRLGNEPHQFSNRDVSQNDWVGLWGEKHADVDRLMEMEMEHMLRFVNQGGGGIRLTQGKILITLVVGV